ncbi:lactate utilization protein [Adhaeribacter swui]|uniref:Lactate utilization protein n=1 Tax=Adhaeribacter swui TaxID=2086471 RepID=A0A7G7G565_9BACT|nr:lactate utilization protein [Adhaeribacter swui]QNF32299.1 lactate utilization protein [Adhaeribacter swui]
MYEARSKDIVLRKVREALAKSAPVVPPTPDFTSDLHPPLDDDLSVTFATNFLKNSGVFIYCESEEDFYDQLFAYKQEKSIENLYVWEQEWQLKLHAAGINFLDDESNFIKQGDAGLTTCEALITRTGSVFVTGTSESGRRLSIFPEKHLIVAYMSQLVPDIKDGLQLIKKKYGNKIPSMISLVSGPSRTADIEKTLVMGAHGPREMVLFLIDDTPH